MDEILDFFRGKEARRSRRAFSRVGWAMTAFLALQVAAQYPLLFLVQALAPQWLDYPATAYLLAAAATYGVAFPASLLILRSLPGRAPERRERPRPAAMASLWLLCMGTVYLSNMVGLWLVDGLGAALGHEIQDPVDSMGELPLGVGVLVSCILAPVAEELLFRKGLIDRLRGWGEGFAAVASALLFALAHGNIYQIPYAFAVGFVLGAIYLRTGRVGCTVLLHGGGNMVSALLLPLSRRLGEPGTLALALLVLWAIAWAISWVFGRRQILARELPRAGWGDGETWGHFLVNPGATLFILAALWVVVRYLSL